MRKITGGVPAQTRLQAHHRLRGLRGAPPAPRQGGQARPERLPPDPAGQEPQGIPQPHQDRLEGVDRRFLHASANRPHGDREIPRGADLLFGLSGGRGSARHHGQRPRKGRGVDPMAQEGLRRRLLPRTATPQGHRRAGQPRGLSHAAAREQAPARTGREAQRQNGLHQRRALRGRRQRRGARPADLSLDGQGPRRPQAHALLEAGVAQDDGRDGRDLRPDRPRGDVDDRRHLQPDRVLLDRPCADHA